jgi:hypothetical protein
MCPALGQKICAICCGTKRLVEIRCPGDCAYLVSSREHPPAAAIRQQQRDLGTVVRFMNDLNDRQSRLFFLILTLLARYRPPELYPIIDNDVKEAMAALAGTFETAARGVIYEHRPPSGSAERLVGALKPLLAEASRQGGGTTFEREAAIVLRRIEAAARESRSADTAGGRVFVDLIGRIFRQKSDGAGNSATPEDSPRLIVP